MMFKKLTVGVARRMNLGRENLYRNDSIKLNAREGCDVISGIIAKGEPAMVSRLGFSEARLLLNYYEIMACNQSRHNLAQRLLCAGREFRSDWDGNICLDICNSSGFFPNDNQKIAEFCKLYMGCMADCDVIGCFKEIPGESFLWKQAQQCPEFVPVSSLEPYLFNTPWSTSLKDKRVLVVHPFAESIFKQYSKNKDRLFQNKDVLPDFELITLPAVQAIRQEKTEFSDWFEALQAMQKKISEISFDVCIIGAGAFGLPLASYVKSLGKISIHMAGTTQILFGIRGKRWELYIPEVARLFNEFWTRPLPHEHPQDYANNEGGAYW